MSLYREIYEYENRVWDLAKKPRPNLQTFGPGPKGGYWQFWGKTKTYVEKPADAVKPKPTAKAKEPWEMNADEYAAANKHLFPDARHPMFSIAKAKREHGRIVTERALSGGEIPPERIEEYPFLDFDKMRKGAERMLEVKANQDRIKKIGRDRKAAIKAEKARPMNDAKALAGMTLDEYMKSKNVSDSRRKLVLSGKLSGFGRRVVDGETIKVPGSYYLPHYDAVKKVVDAGLRVSKRVLKDYPGLADND